MNKASKPGKIFQHGKYRKEMRSFKKIKTQEISC